MNRAIFSMDPGGHTGLAWGIVDVNAGSLEEALKGIMARGSATIVGDEREQIRAIADLWMVFYRDCVNNRCLDPEYVEFISEDFVQRPGGSGGKEGQSPIRVLWGVEGYRMGREDEFKGRRGHKTFAPPIILQHPSLGSGITTARLRDWGLWVVGKEHERSAFRHLAVRVGKIQQNL